MRHSVNVAQTKSYPADTQSSKLLSDQFPSTWKVDNVAIQLQVAFRLILALSFVLIFLLELNIGRLGEIFINRCNITSIFQITLHL